MAKAQAFTLKEITNLFVTFFKDDNDFDKKQMAADLCFSADNRIRFTTGAIAEALSELRQIRMTPGSPDDHIDSVSPDQQRRSVRLMERIERDEDRLQRLQPRLEAACDVYLEVTGDVWKRPVTSARKEYGANQIDAMLKRHAVA